jgi:hypothetical protein
VSDGGAVNREELEALREELAAKANSPDNDDHIVQLNEDLREIRRLLGD